MTRCCSSETVIIRKDEIWDRELLVTTYIIDTMKLMALISKPIPSQPSGRLPNHPYSTNAAKVLIPKNNMPESIPFF